MENKGELFVNYALEKNVDPYLAVSIVLVETGCKWNCSRLVKQCNNVGGQHGSVKCGSGPYAKFGSLEEGIKAFIDNLANNYIQKDLTTTEQIGTKYATGKTWSEKVNNYIMELKKN